jgi:MFS family permease
LSEQHGLQAQRALWKDSNWRRWVLAASFVRLCGTMLPFGLLLAGQAALGSFSTGAWMTAVYSAGAALAAPFRGRAMDRRRLPDAMRPSLLALAALGVAIALACAVHAPLPVLLGLSLLLGVIPAGVAGAYRALLPKFLPPQLLAPAFSIDAVLIEVTWIAGPPLVGALALVHSSLTLGLIALCALVAVVANRRLPPREPPASASEPAARQGLNLGPLLRGLPLFVFIGVVVTGVSWGMLDTALPPRLVQLGSHAELWGGLAALMSVTSAVGGLVSAGVAQPASAREALVRSLALLAFWSAFLLPVGLVAGVPGIAVCLAISGFALAPLVGLLTYLLQQTLPAERHAEGFAVYGACWSLGIGVGSGLTAVFLEHASARAALVVSGGIPLAMVACAAVLSGPLLRIATRSLPPLTGSPASGPGEDAEAGTP